MLLVCIFFIAGCSEVIKSTRIENNTTEPVWESFPVHSNPDNSFSFRIMNNAEYLFLFISFPNTPLCEEIKNNELELWLDDENKKNIGIVYILVLVGHSVRSRKKQNLILT